MSKIERCEIVPTRQELAIAYAGRIAVGTKAEMDPLYAGLISHRDFWHTSASHADRDSNMGRWKMSADISKACDGRIEFYDKEWRRTVPRDRADFIREVLSLVACSQLYYNLLGVEQDIIDATSTGYAAILLENKVGAEGQAFGFRLHLDGEVANYFFAPPLSDPPKEGTWYESGDLRIRRPLQVDYGPYFPGKLAQMGIRTDTLSAMHTFIPHHLQHAPLTLVQ